MHAGLYAMYRCRGRRGRGRGMAWNGRGVRVFAELSVGGVWWVVSGLLVVVDSMAIASQSVASQWPVLHVSCHVTPRTRRKGEGK